MSVEFRVLRAPAATFRELAASNERGAWTLLRRPLALALAMGATTALNASGRVSARLIFDGMIAWAFVPLFMIAAVTIVHRRGASSSLAHAVDTYFAANVPWLLWLLAECTWRTFLTPIQATTMLDRPYWILVWSPIPVVAWSTYLDLQYFRAFSVRREQAGRNLLLARAVSWLCIVGWFAGHEFWEYFALWMKI